MGTIIIFFENSIGFKKKNTKEYFYDEFYQMELSFENQKKIWVLSVAAIVKGSYAQHFSRLQCT